MRSKKLKVCSLILMTAVCSTLSSVPHKAEAATTKKGVVYITKDDVKNGKVIIKNKKAKTIVIKSSVKKATIQLTNVKLSGMLSFKKGDFVLKTSKTSIKNVKISGKNAKIRLDKSSDLNNKNLTLTVAKNATGKLDLSSFAKNVNVNLGANTNFNIAVGNKESAKLTVKKATATSSLEVSGSNENAKVKKITVESPAKIAVTVKADILEVKKSAEGGSVALHSEVDKIKNDTSKEIMNTYTLEESSKTEDKKEEKKLDNKKDKKKDEEKSKNNSTGSSSGSTGGSGSASTGSKTSGGNGDSAQSSNANKGGSSNGGGASGGGSSQKGGGGSASSGGGGASSGGGSSMSSGGGSALVKQAKGIKFKTTNFDLTKDGEELKIEVEYIEGNSGKIKWRINDKDTDTHNVADKVSDTDKNIYTIKAKNNGKYTVTATLEGGQSGYETYISHDGNVNGQIVAVDDSQKNTYICGDKKLTKKEGTFEQKKYILQINGGDKYSIVNANGVASGSYSRVDAVKHLSLQQLSQGIKEITGLNDENTYKVVEVTKEDELEAEDKTLIDKYMNLMKYEVDDIKFKKLDEIKKDIEEVVEALQERSQKDGKNPVFADNVDHNIKAATWVEVLQKAREKKNILLQKINENNSLLDSVKNTVAIEINKLKLLEPNNKVTDAVAVAAVDNIESEIQKITTIDKNYSVNPDIVANNLYDAYEEVKAEVATYKKMDEQKITYYCKKDGNYVLTVTKKVLKEGSDNEYDEVSTTFEKGLKYEIGRWNTNFESLSIDGKNISGDITAGVSSFSLKSEFDKLKNGSYAIKITKEFKYFTTNKPFFNTISNDIQEITGRP